MKIEVWLLPFSVQHQLFMVTEEDGMNLYHIMAEICV